MTVRLIHCTFLATATLSSLSSLAIAVNNEEPRMQDLELSMSRSSGERIFKRGIAFQTPQNCDVLENHVSSSWWYSWGRDEGGFTNSFCGDASSAYQQALANGMEFVPMFWSTSSLPTTDQPLDITTVTSLTNAHYLMTFNEPELTDQANVSPQTAAAVWPQIVDIATQYDLELVAPCGTIDEGKVWYEEWLAECERLYGQPCEYDYTCLHAYFQPYPCTGVIDWACLGFDGGGAHAMGKIDSWYNEFGKPTWVTEFACNPWGGVECDADLHQQLMEQFVPLLDESPNVFRYAWFSAQSYTFGNANTNEIVWEHSQNRQMCASKLWIGGFGDAGWQIQTKHECMVKGDENMGCAKPLTLITDDDNCYCAQDDCQNVEPAHPWTHLWREVSDRNNTALTPLGELYQKIGACPLGYASMEIQINTDQNVKKDKTKWTVYLRRKKKTSSGGKWKKIPGLLGSLKNFVNDTVFVVDDANKCLKTKKKCYKVELSEKKKTSNPGMDGYLKVKFDGKEYVKNNWDSGKKTHLLVGKCE